VVGAVTRFGYSPSASGKAKGKAMSVAVLFAGPSRPPHHSEISNALERIPCQERETWEVVFTVDTEDSPWTMTVNGPDYHRHVFRIAGHDPTRHRPDYLAALLNAEISSFPSCPPSDFVLAVGELVLYDIPFDLTDAFSGHITVDGMRTDTRTLIDLYRQQQLNPESLRARRSS